MSEEGRHRPHHLRRRRDAALREWQALQEHRPVALCHDPRIEHENHPGVVVAPHEPSEPLPHPNHGIRQGQLVERVPAPLFYGRHARTEDRLGRHAEREAAEDDHLECFTGSIDPLPERVGGEQNAGALRPKRVEKPRAVVVPFLVIGATDSRQFAPLTDAIVRFMPVMMTAEDLTRIHGVDERISLENYGRMIAYYTNVIRRAAGSRK